MTKMIMDAEIIAHRMEKVRRTVYRTMVDRQWLAVRDTSSVRSFGGVVNLRPLMLMKAAMFDGGQNLLDHWPVMEGEWRIPWSVHAAEIAFSAWGAAGSQMHAKFYSTKTEDFTALELTMPGWHPVEETSIPGFATVSTEDALARIGLVGGVDPDIEHPFLGFSVREKTFNARAGQVTEFDLVADARAEFPVQYEVAAPALDWIAVSGFGTLTLAPPPALGGLFLQGINATDGLGRTVLIEIQVSVA